MWHNQQHVNNCIACKPQTTVITCRTLQKQEEAREAALNAFHDMIAARAAHAGAAAAAENKSRQEREERLVAASEAKAKAEAEVGEAVSQTA